MEEGRELREVSEQSNELVSKLSDSIIAKFNKLNLTDRLLDHFIYNIDRCNSKLAIIKQLYLCYVQFKPALKSAELAKPISVPNTIRLILMKDFGITADLTKPKATTEALFDLLRQMHHEAQQAQQKDIPQKPAQQPLNLSYRVFATTNADLYHANAKQVHYDSGVEKIPTSKATLALQLAHLLAGSFAAAHGKAAGFESVTISQRAIRREMDKQDPTLAIEVNPNIEETKRTKAITAGERSLELARFPVYQILYQHQPTNVLFMSELQAQTFITAAKMNHEAFDTNTHKWAMDKIHPDPIEMSLQILGDLIKNTPGSFKPYQAIATRSIQDLIDRTLVHQDPETFKQDLASTVELLENFLTNNNISAKPFISALKTAEEKCQERFAVIARAKEELPRPDEN